MFNTSNFCFVIFYTVKFLNHKILNYSFFCHFESARSLISTTNDNKNIFNKKDLFTPINYYK